MSAASVFRLLPASLALIPLAIAPGILFYFDVTPKIAVLLIVTALCLFLAKPKEFGLRNLLSSREGRWFAWLAAAQAVSILISTASANDIALAVTGSSWRRCGAVAEIGALIFALLLAARVAVAPETIRLVLQCCTVGCLIAALYGIAQFFGIDPFLPAQSYHVGEGIWTIVRPPSTLGHANYFAHYLVYATFFSAALMSKGARDGWPWMAAAFCLGSAAIVLSGARAGILGLAAGLIIAAVGGSARWRRRIAGFGLCGVALLACLAATPVGRPLRARIRWSREDAFGGGRLLLWRDSARMLGTRWLTGFGPDQFSREFPKFQSLELAQAHPDFYQESPHNVLLDAAVAQGLPGAILTMAMLALGVFAAWKRRASEAPYEGWLAACLGAALIGGAICGQFNSPVLVTRVYQLSSIAILCGAGCRARTEDAGVPFFARPLCWAGGAALLLFAIALLASDALAGSFKRSAESGDIAAAADRYRRLASDALPGFNIDLYASRVFAKSLARRPALLAGERAARTAEDRQNAFFSLAQLYAQQEDAAGTERNLRLAIQAAPQWFKPHWILAELLKRTGRLAEAREQARLAMRDDAGKDLEIVRAWEALGSPR